MLFERNKPDLLSIVIPMYNEEETFPFLKAELQRVTPEWGCKTELILVDDGSCDRTYDLMYEWAMENPDVKTISLSRNYGHQIAVTTGLDAANGDAIVIMDADLQDPPSVVEEMLSGYCKGYDVVYGQRLERHGESIFKRGTAKLFYWLMRRYIAPNLPDNTGDFRLISRRVADALRRMPERERFLRGMVTWIGFHQIAVTYNRPGRVAGTTKYPFWKMFKLALTAITAFSDAPLRLVSWLGFGSMAFSLFLMIRTLYLYFFGDVPLVLGWATLSILLCLFSGLIMVSIGAVGLYIGKIFVESQHRPLYLVQHTQNLEGDSFR